MRFFASRIASLDGKTTKNLTHQRLQWNSASKIFSKKCQLAAERQKKIQKVWNFLFQKASLLQIFLFSKLFFHFLEKAFFGGRNCLKVPQEKTHLQIFEQFFKSRTESDEEIRARIELHSRLFPKHHDECNKFIYAYPMMSVRP